MNIILYIVIFLSFNGIYGQEIRKTIKDLPDTGQNTGYTTVPGEDADYSIHPPSYTDLQNGIVIDNVTGLYWQKTDAGEMTHEQAIMYADTATLGGFTDWRLPSPLEAYSIINFTKNKPPLDLTVFSASTAEYWWTNLAQYNDGTKVWVTNAGGGIGNHLKKETISAGGTKKFHARIVRDPSIPPILPAPYIRTDYGTVIDLKTNLEWFTNPSPDSMNCEQALQFAEQSIAGTHDDWRMPNAKELFSLTNQAHSSPSIHPMFGITTSNTMYWSSTTLQNQTDKAWYMDSRYGITTYAFKTQRLKVLPVRNANTANGIVEAKTFSPIRTIHSSIFIKDLQSNDRICIYDMLGHCIISEYAGSNDWQSHALPIGAYLIHIIHQQHVQSGFFIISP